MQRSWQDWGLRIPPGGRWSLVLIGIGLSAGFLLALALEPDPRGYGTHQRLGLPECTFLTLFNRPCPGCGMTTSFSNFVRGRWRDAYESNPAGLLLALVCTASIPWCWWSAYRGRLWLVSDPWLTLAGLMGACGGSSLIVWLLRWWS